MRTVALVDVVDGLSAAGIPHSGGGDAQISSVEHRSDRVEPGALFCCIPGHRVDGHDHAGEAVSRGAVGLLVERHLALDVPQVVVPSVRAAMGPAAARFWGDPSRSMTVIGVTGTNGKTTTVSMLDAIFTEAGRSSRRLGTLTAGVDGPPTTPDAPALQEQLATWRDEGVEVVSLEVSSHALAMGRVDGTWFAATVFTTLGHDHLDLHQDMEAYFAAKASLFRSDRTDRAVICADDAYGRRLLAVLEGTPVSARTFSLDDAEDLGIGPAASTFTVGGVPVRLPLVGAHNVRNALGALAVADWLGVATEVAARGLGSLAPIPGRYELLDRGQPFAVAVDYAHTPDALATVLGAARDQAEAAGGRVVVVFGCGGDKDRAKRPEMGRVAAERADVVIVTSDNPRSEDPAAIAEEILAGTRDVAEGHAEVLMLLDRDQAIHHAIALARDHDVVLIAGKGHETTQVFSDRVVTFDDRAVAARALSARVERHP